MKALFGTDGIRGLAGEFPLDEQTVRSLGASVAGRFAEKLGRSPKFVSGRDTRESGSAIETAFHAGAVSAGAICESSGVITTPGVAYLTSEFGFDAGIVISASHNPFRDNGIKIFMPDGKKLDAAMEKEIEADIHSGFMSSESEHTIDDSRAGQFCSSYIQHLKDKADIHTKLDLKIVLDCANGAASALASELFGGIVTDAVILHNDPDGRNINENCGSTHIDGLADRVVAEGADMGIAFDGDADRALFVDASGTVVDGDAVLWIMAKFLKAHGKLTNSKIVATVMSNIGLEIALGSIGVELVRADVGDKYVLERLIATGSEVGGEQSGHIIYPQISLVGDGMMTALMLLKALDERGITLADAVEGFVRFPQILKNVKVREKKPFGEVIEIAEEAKTIEGELAGEGRLLLRYSGTENLARVMIEGKDQRAIEDQADRLIARIASVLG